MENMKRHELVAMAKARHIKYCYKMKKQELIDAMSQMDNAPPVVLPHNDLSNIENMKFHELKNIGKALHVKYYYKLKKSVLLDTLIALRTQSEHVVVQEEEVVVVQEEVIAVAREEEVVVVQEEEAPQEEVIAVAREEEVVVVQEEEAPQEEVIAVAQEAPQEEENVVAQEEEAKEVPFDYSNRRIAHTFKRRVFDKVDEAFFIKEVIPNMPKRVLDECDLEAEIEDNRVSTLSTNIHITTHAKFVALGLNPPPYEDFTLTWKERYFYRELQTLYPHEFSNFIEQKRLIGAIPPANENTLVIQQNFSVAPLFLRPPIPNDEEKKDSDTDNETVEMANVSAQTVNSFLQTNAKKAEAKPTKIIRKSRKQISVESDSEDEIVGNRKSMAAARQATLPHLDIDFSDSEPESKPAPKKSKAVASKKSKPALKKSQTKKASAAIVDDDEFSAFSDSEPESKTAPKTKKNTRLHKNKK